jgi:hypothetical protein
VIVIIILLHLISKCKEQNELLKNSQWELVEKLAISQEYLMKANKENDSLRAIIVSLTYENSMLREALEKCELSRKASEKASESSLAREISKMKKEISELSSKIDSALNGMDVKMDSILNKLEAVPCDTISADTTPDFAVKNLSFVVTKKTFNKKMKVLNESEIKNYRSTLVYAPKIGGFYKDSIFTTYNYQNENADSVTLGFKSFIEGDRISLDVRENRTVVLFFGDEKRALGAGGLLTGLDYPLSWENKFPIKERTVDKNLLKNGIIEIVGGVLIGGAGGLSYNYFTNNPRAKINLVNPDGSTYDTISIPNDVGQLFSAAIIGLGAGLTIKGIFDIGLAIQIRPGEIGFIYQIQ